MCVCGEGGGGGGVEKSQPRGRRQVVTARMTGKRRREQGRERERGRERESDGEGSERRVNRKIQRNRGVRGGGGGVDRGEKVSECEEGGRAREMER